MPKKRKPTGPKPERLRLKGDWKALVKRALTKGKSPKPPDKKRDT
jgi:hypothetical protein